MKEKVPSSKPVVVLISADAEWRVISELLPGPTRMPSVYGEWFNMQVHAKTSPDSFPVIFFHSGWGKISAAGSTQYAIDRWQPDLLINLGTCGGFEGEIERGAIILVEKTIVYDIIEQMGDYQAHIDHYSTQLDLSWLPTNYPHPVIRTLLVSGDRDLVIEEIPTLKERYRAVAGDWESGAIAFVARRNGVRLIILRGVTDLVSPQGSEAYGNISYFENASRSILNQLVDWLPEWIKLGNTVSPS